MTNAILWTIVILIGLAIIIAVFAWFYERATNEISLIRTGIGGRKVVIDGGTLAIPYFHEISRVNMQTLRLDVRRTGEASLITKDRMRVDVGAEFYLSVIPTEDGIGRASQTLGRRTFQPDLLRDLIDGMLIDALRSVAARLSMDELHENRGSFVSDVRDSLRDVLAGNGLQVDSVSLTSLDQTSFAALDDNNAFNAVGMRKLAEVISESKKERAEIDADVEVSVRRAAMEASKRKLQIDLEQREAEIFQQQEIETLMAAQLTEVARRKADGEREAAQARISMEQEIQTAEIFRQRTVQEVEIARDRDLQVAEQDRDIVIATKSQEKSKAHAAADTARAGAVKAAEMIVTARQIAEAERLRDLALITGQADREEADTLKYEALAEAEGARALYEAENLRSEHIVGMETALARLDALPKIVAEMVKPAEKINAINIHHLSGFGGAGASSGGDRPVVNQALDSIMEMAVQLPALKRLGEEVGMSFDKGPTGLDVTGDDKEVKGKED